MSPSFARWLCACLCLYTSLSFAACPDPNKAIFQPSCKDASVYYLRQIFGGYDLNTAGFTPQGSQLFAQLTRTITNAMLWIGIAFIIYILISSALQMALTGKFLGESGNLWLPLRMVMGFALLLPKGVTGYTFAQSLVMWIIFSGIGAADTVWNQVTTQFANQSIYSAAKAGDAGASQQQQLISDIKPVVAQVFRGMVCRYMYNYEQANFATGGKTQHIIAHVTSGNDPNLYPNYLALDGVIDAQNMNWHYLDGLIRAMMAEDNAFRWFTYDVLNPGASASLVFGMYLPDVGRAQNACGQIDGVGVKYPYFVNFLNDTRDIVRQVVIQFEQNKTNLNNLTIAPALVTDFQKKALTFAQCLADKTNSKDCRIGQTGGNYEAKSIGWASMGFYYTGLASYGLGGSRPDQQSIPSYQLEPHYDNTLNKMNNTPVSGVFMLLANRIADTLTQSGRVDKANPLSEMYEDAAAAISKPSQKSADFGFYLVPLSRTAQSFIKDMAAIFKASGDPFTQARDTGYGLMTTASLLIIMGAVAIFFPALAALTCREKIGVGDATAETLNYVGMVAMQVSTALFAEGAIYAIFLPFIPLLAWIMGVTGWFMAVIEAVIAAPLVALALIWPDTQMHVFGRAEGAIVLLLNVVLRPALLVLAFLFAMLLCKIAFSLAGLMLAIAASRQVPIIHPDEFFGWIAVGYAFGYALLSVAGKCFALTSELPDRVVGYLGVTVSRYGDSKEAIRGAKEGTQRGGKLSPRGEKQDLQKTGREGRRLFPGPSDNVQN